MFKDKRKAVVGRPGVALFLLLLTLTVPGTAWADMMFLKIDGIPGDSIDAKHRGWINIRNWDWSQIQPTAGSASTGGGATSQRVVFRRVNFTTQTGKHSPKLFLAGAGRTPIKEVTLEVCRAGTDRVKWLEIKLNDVFITGYSILGSEQAHNEEILFGYSKIVVTYTMQKRADGSGSGQVAGGWDLISNKPIINR